MIFIPVLRMLVDAHRGKAFIADGHSWPDRHPRHTHDRIEKFMDVLEAAGVFANGCQVVVREHDFDLDPRGCGSRSWPG